MIHNTYWNIISSRRKNWNYIFCIGDFDHPSRIIIWIKIDKPCEIAGMWILKLNEDLYIRLTADEFYVYGVFTWGNSVACVLSGGNDQWSLRTAIDFVLVGLAICSSSCFTHTIGAILYTKELFYRYSAKRYHCWMLSDSNLKSKRVRRVEDNNIDVD